MSAVGAWLAEPAAGDLNPLDAKFSIMKEINNKLSVAQLDQLTTHEQRAEGRGQGAEPIRGQYFDQDSYTVDLTLGIGASDGQGGFSRGVTLEAFDMGGLVTDLTAEVDFEIGPDVSRELTDLLENENTVKTDGVQVDGKRSGVLSCGRAQ